MSTNVTDENVRAVLDGLKNFLQQSVAAKEFSVMELKNFMEPIFEREGYREQDKGGKSIDNILIVHEAATGDFVEMSAAIREIRRAYPAAHITLVVSKKGENLAECCPHVDEIIVRHFFLDSGKSLQSAPDDLINIEKKFLFHLDVAEELLRRRYDIAFTGLYSARPSTPLLAYMSGAVRRIAHKRGMWFPLLTDVVPQKNNGIHAADKVLSYVERAIGKRITDRHLEAWFNKDDIDAVKALLPEYKKLIAICVGGKARNRYPPASYGALLNLIAKENDDAKFIVIGGSADVEEADMVGANVDEPERVINLAGKLTYRQTATAISICNTYIGNDIGAMHLAAATNVPVLSPNCFPLELKSKKISLNRWYPYYVPSVTVCPNHALSACKGSKKFYGCHAKAPHCITQITPQRLFDAYKMLLDRIAADNKAPLIIGSD